MREARIKVPTPLVSASLAVWGASLAVLFLIHQTAAFTPINASHFWELADAHTPDYRQLLYSSVGVMIAALIVLSWHGLGHLIARLVRVDGEDSLLGFVRQIAWGAGFWSLLWLLLGLIQLYRGWIAASALITGLFLFILSAPFKRARGRVWQSGGDSRFALTFLFLLSLLALIAALAPPTAKDTLLYHFSLPKAYLAIGGLVEVPYNIAGYLPLGAEMHSVWAMLVGRLVNVRVGEAAASAVQFAFYPLLLAGVYGWAREHAKNRRWAAALAALILATVPTAYYVAANAYVDLAHALYVMLAIQAIGRWWTRQDEASLVCFALALGFALCVKLTAVFLALPALVLVLLKINALQKRGVAIRKTMLAAAASLLAAALLASPWYLKTWAQTGSPVFPFYLNIWEGHALGWDVERSLMFQTINSTYGGYPKTALDYLLAPFKLSIAAQPEDPAHFDGVLGASFLLGLPILIWAWWSSRLAVELKIAAALSFALFIFWLFSSQQMRYLLPALPGLAVAISCAADSLRTTLNRRASGLISATFACSISAAFFVICAWFLVQNPLFVLIGIEPRTNYLARRLDYFPYYELINRTLPPTARVWLINMRRDTYHLERPYFSDYMFEDYTLEKYIDQATSAAHLTRLVSDTGITHILIRHDVLLDYSRSPIVDESLTQQENLNRIAILKAFLMTQNKVMLSDNKFMLVEIAVKKQF